MSDYCDIAPEFYSEERVKARKVHVCVECHRVIPIGTVYVRIAGKWDGEFAAETQHVECRDFAAHINLDYIGECLIPFGSVDAALRSPDDFGILEELSDPPDTLDRLRAEWSRIKVLYPEREAA